MHGLIRFHFLTYYFLVAVPGRAAEFWFKKAKERHATLNAIIYGNIIYAHWCVIFQFFFRIYF